MRSSARPISLTGFGSTISTMRAVYSSPRSTAKPTTRVETGCTGSTEYWQGWDAASSSWVRATLCDGNSSSLILQRVEREAMFKFIHAADIHLDSPLLGIDRYEGAPVE